MLAKIAEVMFVISVKDNEKVIWWLIIKIILWEIYWFIERIEIYQFRLYIFNEDKLKM